MKSIKYHAVRNPLTTSVVLVGGVVGCFFITPSESSAASKTIDLTQGSLKTSQDIPSFVTPYVAPAVAVVTPRPKVVDFSYLNQAKVGGIMSIYIGHQSRDSQGNIIPLPDQVTVDFANNLQRLWNKKLAITGVSRSTQKNADFIVDRYRTSDPEFKGIKTFIRQIDRQAKIAHGAIDFPALCNKMRIKEVQCGVLESVTARIEGTQLAAYGMTEVMPTQNGNFNYVMLDTLLRNAGEGFVQAIPALGDKLMSLGFYQFTSHAVYDADSSEGASYVNRFVTHREAKIPGSVIRLQGREHHRAAFYFVTYNLGRLMQKLSEKEALRLEGEACNSDGIAQFMATAHHMPTRAIRNTEDWIQDKCKKPITSYMGSHLRLYAKKTKSNLDAIESRM